MKSIGRIDKTDLRDFVYRGMYEAAMDPAMRFGDLAVALRGSHYKLSPDLECDLGDELSELGKSCKLKYYGNEYYVFDGLIWVPVSLEVICDAFRFFMSRMGLKLTEGKRKGLLNGDFLPSVRINSRLCPRLDVVAFKNGVLDLSDYTFHAPSPDFHVIYQHPYKYDAKAKCPKWNHFLKEVLPDKSSRVILQMFLGLGLIERGTIYNQFEHGDKSKVELCLILLGSGANGKSVIYQTAMGLFGAERISGVDYDELTGSGDEGMRSRRMLRDAIFNWSSDSDANTFGRKRTGVFKRIVSGEPVLDRGIGENVQQNYKLPYLIFNLNELPYPNDTSLGFIRRLQFVAFDVTIPPDKQNKHLAQDLVPEYPGIFNWLIRGAKELKRRKYIFPSSEGSRRQMLLAQLKMNPILAWCTAYGARARPQANQELCTKMKSTDIMESLTRFCEDNDVDCPSAKSIGHILLAKGFAKKNKAWGKEYEMYGVDANAIMRPFVIRNEDFDLGYRRDLESFIDEED